MRDYIERKLSMDKLRLDDYKARLKTAVEMYINEDCFEKNTISMLMEMKSIKEEIAAYEIALQMRD